MTRQDRENSQRNALSRRTVIRSVGVGLAGLSPLASVLARPARAQGTRRVTDCRNRVVMLGENRKIACIGGTITETLCDFGLADRIVAVDTTSTSPPEMLETRKSLGYMRTLSAEGVLSVLPDLVLCMNDAGPPAAIAQLIASSVPVVMVDATPSADAVVARTRFLANVLDCQAQGEKLASTIESGFQALSDWRTAHAGQKTRVMFVMTVRNNRPMAAGTGTAADSIITLTGSENALSSMKGYKILNDEALLTVAPDVVVLMEQGGERLKSDMMAMTAFRETPAGKNNAFVLMEGEWMLGFGPRTPQAAMELAQRIASVRQAG